MGGVGRRNLLQVKLNQVFADSGLAWASYGQGSSFFIYLNPNGQPIDPLNFDPLAVSYQDIKSKPPGLLNKLRLALLIGGVDISGSGGGVISATHDEADLEQTVAAFDQATAMLISEEDLPRT